MAIRPISKEEFDELAPFRGPLAASAAEEVEWWTDDAKRMIGFVARDRIDNDWLWVIQGRDERGQFRAFAVESSIESSREARDELLARMNQVEGTSQFIFPQNVPEKSTESPDWFDEIVKDKAKNVITKEGEEASSLEVLVDSGSASDELIAETLARISILYRRAGGSGISFALDGVHVFASDPDHS